MIIGYTAGVFDLFHVGHLNLLRNAKGLCDKLIVGVTADDLVRYEHKVAVIPFEDRMEIVKSIQYVDAVVAQDDMDKLAMCKKLKADVLFVGDDWYQTDKWQEYEKEFNKAGIKIIYFPYTKGVSSTKISQSLDFLWESEIKADKLCEREISIVEDKRYCMSAFLMFRSVLSGNVTFKKGIKPYLAQEPQNRHPVKNGDELLKFFERRVKEITQDGTAALALSGGIDSAILAKFMPKGTTVYIFKCVVPGKKVLDETPMAQKYAEICGLNPKVVEIYWEDFEKYAPLLMEHKGAPIHLIEVQIYKAALQAKQDGVEHLVFGENADAIYGGMSGLLSQDWKIGDFIERFSYILPYKVLKDAQMIVYPFQQQKTGGDRPKIQMVQKFLPLAV